MTASTMTGIPFEVLKAEAEKSKDAVPEPVKAKDLPKEPTKPSGTLEICLPCFDDSIKIDQVESFEHF